MAKHLLSLWDFNREQLNSYLDLALQLKKESKGGVRHQHLAGKIVGLIFEKPSTRTRVSFESAMYGLGGQVIYLSSRDTQLARNEPLKDMARVMDRYVDALVVRTFGQEVVDELARYSAVPIINALTDLHHPCQVLSDVMTVIEKLGSIEGRQIAWVGDGNNMANSWIQAAGRLGFNLTLACPGGYNPDPAILKAAQDEGGGRIEVVRDPLTAVRNAEVINVDVWASMGQEEEYDSRLKVFEPYQINKIMLDQAGPNTIVLHCLPAHRGEEITDEVLEGPQCVAFDQAENKLHIHKAILAKHLS